MATRKTRDRDFLLHLNAYLDDTLKISRCATKIILSSSLLPKTPPLHHHLKSFESSDVNTLRASHLDSKQDLILSLIPYGGEGIYYFVEQFVVGGQDVSIEIMTSWGLTEEFFFSVRKLRKLREKKLMKLSMVQDLAELA
ncbi:hypothetical protein BT93_L1278 [Corymbia citriodora subsp. variegata]|uniref:Uncharacterized protein n=1 Tax=Corymbia citriodora subsp. variegata TaxID=360336 RepID=A0A8T0CN74_CORYI|nr:hypothetical protein BT93_L1278 [Corymbia citriodora subsp. variegata]